MKKWMIGCLIGMIFLLGASYILVPNSIALRANTGIKVSGATLHRMLMNKNNVIEWWPGISKNGSFHLNSFTYNINKGNVTLMPVNITGDNTDLNTTLFLVSIITDSTQIQWVGSMKISQNPFKRFNDYLKAKEINRDMGIVLQSMEKFFSMPQNVYGVEIKKVLVVDSFLISTTESCKGYPTNRFVYSLIDKLRNYANMNAAKERGYPMLNIQTSDSINFNVKVAIPTNILLPSSGPILQKRMPPGCIILVTQVKGGTTVASGAFEQMENYLDDYQLKSAAIPFYSLVTDRIKEPDTSKWITKIYFPVMMYKSELK